MYNTLYIMHITLLSFGVQQCLFEGGYYYAHLGAACSSYMNAAKIQENTVCIHMNKYSRQF